MQRLEVSGAVRPIYGSLGFKRLKKQLHTINEGLSKNKYEVYLRLKALGTNRQMWYVLAL